MANTFTIEAAKSANLRLVEEEGKGLQALHDTITAYRANRRQGNANTKNRSEVAGSGKKLWKQKGTGRARMGSARSPIWTGGGVVWGPRTRDWTIKVPKKVKSLAFRTALTNRIGAGDVINVESFAIADGKTKSFVKAINEITTDKKVLVISANFDDATFLSARNVQRVLLMSAAEVNAEHLLNYDKIVIVSSALETLANRTA